MMKNNEEKATQMLTEVLANPELLKQPGVFEKTVIAALAQLTEQVKAIHEAQAVSLI